MANLIDLTGKTFNKLTVLKKDMNNTKRVKWVCRCECGNLKSILSTHLISGATNSCGCYQKEMNIKSKLTHGLTKTSLYNRWKEMRSRCLNPNHKRYKDYGERGITVYPKWIDSFESFKKWADDNHYKEHLSLDRIDNDKGYCPENCRWTNEITQNRNKRNIVYIFNGKSKIALREVSDIVDINYNTLYTRYQKLGKINIDVKDILNDDKYMLIPSQSS